MNLAIKYFCKWGAKGVNPNNTFPRNPKGGGLTKEQHCALNVGAILSGTNNVRKVLGDLRH